MGGWDQNGSKGDWVRVKWIHLAQDGDRWRVVANAVMNLWGSSAMEFIVIITPSQANVAVPHYDNSKLPHHFCGL
jgi:hypothetical protein